MLAGAIKLLVGLAVWVGPGAEAGLSPQLQAEISRLEGHEIRVDGASYEIVDVAGEGAPRVGCVRKTARGLELESGGETLLLRGPLAVSRIAGPNYKVWVLGALGPNGELVAARLGILAGPTACPAR